MAYSACNQTGQSNQCGATYIFKYESGIWGLIAKLRGAMVQNGHYGWSVAIRDSRLFVAALSDPNSSGTPIRPGLTYYYDLSSTGPDCDCDGLADSCELFAGENDCNVNSIPDSCDVVNASSSDCNLNGVPDECEPDCQSNGVADQCDVNSGTSLDCNGNGTPDECEEDCNANQLPDDCDIAFGTSQDCNGNGKPDECDVSGSNDCNANQSPDSCDIASGFSQDTDGDGRPDECGPFPLPALIPEPSGSNKVRFLSFVNPTEFVENTAIRIWLVSLHHVDPPYRDGPSIPFTAFEGLSVWVGPTSAFMESQASGVPFTSSPTQCAPYYQDWTSVGLLHVRGSAIVPSSVYEVEQVSANCQGVETSCTAVSPRLEIRTGRWGDVEEAFSPSPGQPSFSDIAAVLNKFRGRPGAPIKARLVIQSDTTKGDITDASLSVEFGFKHISAVVDAFRGKPYSAMMGRCSGDATTACTTDADCATAGVAGPCILNCVSAP